MSNETKKSSSFAQQNVLSSTARRALWEHRTAVNPSEAVNRSFSWIPWCYTDQQHRLEKEWQTGAEYKIITQEDQIQDISGNQRYDLVPEEGHVPYYPYTLTKTKKALKNRARANQRQQRSMIKNMRKRSILIEKDRTTKYEKRFIRERSEQFEWYHR